MQPLLLSTLSSRQFADTLASHLQVPLVDVERRVFPDGEAYLRLPTDARFGLLGRPCVLVGATQSQTSTEELYRLGSAAVKNGTPLLVFVIPYFGYSTMERGVRPGEVVTAKVIARQLSGVPRTPRGNWVVLMDLHAAGIVHYFEGDAVALELYAQPVIVAAIRGLGLERLTLASTDMGRAKWVEAFANELEAPVALIHKRRLSGSETRIAAVVGDVQGRDVVIFDDMIRTGGSLAHAAEAYRQAGARSVRVVATHLVLPPGSVERVEAAPLDAILGTDTHPNHQVVSGRPRWRVVSVAGLFAEAVGRLIQ